jgi:restriction system protein
MLCQCLSGKSVWRPSDTIFLRFDAHGHACRARIRATGHSAPVLGKTTPADSPARLDEQTFREAVPPSGFERLAQRLLREAGFTQVVVTGKSNDGGIDGYGTLQINPLVSFKVLFQCKRYQKSVASSHVGDFRGAMSGRADKGIIITTGSFTAEARREATRDGAPPIELIDGDKLIDMMQNLELGLKPVTTYAVDPTFFNEFKTS